MRFSQNFLIDEGVADRQVSYANLNENDVVLEIGAGNGILTKRIAKIAKVIAIEIDERFIPKLKNIKNVEIINADITELDLKDIYFNKVISNIPYHISSEITFKLLEKKFDLGILMYQKEFAERLVARDGKNYSRLSVMVYSKADVEILEFVSRKAFRPTPKVDSCIVKIVPIGKRFSIDDKIFEEVVRVLFSHRRKKIKNSLSLCGLLSKEEAEKIDVADLRVEELSPEKIAEICRIVEEKNEMEKNI
ncbi:MAG: ribosomal RNA small subunit methyltransferase A [Thermoplasmatales archaeon]|nr:ribosomal RNA small subunit methyltransferase A [Thermoplasmatales archaeon]